MSPTPTPEPPTNPGRRLATQAAILALVLVLVAWHAWPGHQLRVIFLATKGDAVLIQTPAGGYVLIDGGGDPAALSAALGRQLPFWRRTLDVVVLTAADGAHLPGQVAALARYRAGLAIAPAIAKRSALIAEWRRLLSEQHTPIRSARAGQRLDIGGATLSVLAAGDGDEGGLVLRLDYGATSVVFDHSGGEADEETLTAASLRPASLLVFPWQRDAHNAFVTALRPRAMVLTDGQQADKPIEQTFVERAIGGAALYHERLDGEISWISDGRRAWVETER
jgi:beta-lactamase superfamily II metal-dependent hydrolase